MPDDKGLFYAFVEAVPKGQEESYLIQLGNRLWQNERVAIVGRSHVRVSGLGGIGKSSLALRYAYLAEENNLYDVVHWIEAETELGIRESYKKLLKKLRQPFKGIDDDQVLKNLKRTLASKTFLLIYDNVPVLYGQTRSDNVLAELLPQKKKHKKGQGHFLMTSRRVSDSSGDQWRNFPLGVWRPEEAIAYLVQCTGLEAIETPELRKIAEEMGHLPLALKHAGSYLKQKKCRTAVDFSKYLKDFRTKGSKLKGFRFRGPNDNTVATTWRMTMDVTSDLCHQIMAYCSYLNPDKIPVDLLNSSEDDDITEAIETLDKYSMISYQGSEFISVHRLVQWVIRQQNRENQKEILENDLPEKILSYFEHSFKSDISDEKIQERSLNLVQHIVALIGHADNEGRPYADDHFLFGLGQVMNLTILISLVGEDKEREIEYRHELKKTRPLLFRGANIFFTLDFLEKIFEDCHPLIQFTLGIFYSLAQHDTEQAIKWWTKAGEKENISAQIILGEHYFWSKGVAQDYKQAVKWWTKAAEQEDASAQFNLGYVYAQGKGVVQDDVQAVTWLRQSANQGFVKAICLLGLAHTQGKGVTQDFEKAVMYFSLAAEKGFADGQYNLGVAYDWGKGVTQDYKQAVAWYRKAAEQRHAGAQRNLGNAYYYGNGVEQNDEQAVAWWKGAIERGDETALLNLLCCYFQGRGLEEDPTKHVEWCWKMWKERRLARIGTLGSWSCICL